MEEKAHLIDKSDNVAVAVIPIKAGEGVLVPPLEKEIIINDEISYGHKFALKNLAPGDPVIKYGEVIGIASKKIKMGDHVHVHNLESLRGRGDLEKKDKTDRQKRCS